MHEIVLLLVLIGFPLVYVIRQFKSSYPDYGIWPLFFVMGMFADVVIILFSFMFATNSMEYRHKEVREELVAVADNTHISGFISGGIFIISGNVGSNPVYSMYVKTGENSFGRRDIPADMKITNVHYTNEQPYIISQYQYKDPESIDNIWLKPFAEVDVKVDKKNGRHLEPLKYDLYVPKGSIISQYQLDLK